MVVPVIDVIPAQAGIHPGDKGENQAFNVIPAQAGIHSAYQDGPLPSQG